MPLAPSEESLAGRDRPDIHAEELRVDRLKVTVEGVAEAWPIHICVQEERRVVQVEPVRRPLQVAHGRELLIEVCPDVRGCPDGGLAADAAGPRVVVVEVRLFDHLQALDFDLLAAREARQIAGPRERWRGDDHRHGS
eukprot:CAMPEP_0115570866 /NCGR_PEP_ID=MMETSP0271-20121206/105921_1 /TAXON_ID=71861 /ORGANISM="Scrippsiella trochoidea, Strain CCMP3099" /LENGTH=137 /DNA_ID=CAMNT_0003005419 /DNA_START=82 /DNA_END=496 /DNA_ORIENTATION=+